MSLAVELRYSYAGMTTAARPTWAPAKGGNEQGGTRIFGPSQKYSSRDLAAHTTLKSRYIENLSVYVLIYWIFPGLASMRVYNPILFSINKCMHCAMDVKSRFIIQKDFYVITLTHCWGMDQCLWTRNILLLIDVRYYKARAYHCLCYL